MTISVELKSQLAALSSEVRAELAEFLIESLDTDRYAEVDVAWEQEMRSRVDAIRAGTHTGVGADELFDRLRRKHS
jgi:putative addiction module component (TIGR02574 family)